MKYIPHQYQDIATRHIVDNPVVQFVGGSALLLEMGLGKTVSTLTAIIELLDRGQIAKCLIVAPKRVAEHTWMEEVRKWDHLKDLKVSICVGSARQRTAALNAKADVYCINRENVPWLVALMQRRWPFDMVVLDESSSFKNPQSARFKAMRMVRPKLKRIVALTGTPAPNNLLDLWPQLYLLDRGERLEKTLGAYREKYFSAGMRRGDVVYEYKLTKGDDIMGGDINRIQIYDKISDICISMKAEDWLNLPERIDRNLEVTMPEGVKNRYNDFAKQAFMAIAEKEINAVNAAALTNKLLQFSNGAIYDEYKDVHEIHDLKIDALDEYMEAAQGEPVLVFYNFKSDVSRILAKLKHHKPKLIGGAKDIDDWNAGKINMLLAHPASAGHGLNMQRGGNRIVWFGLMWSLELYQQAVARLHRQGQVKSVINTHIICPGTMDEIVLARLTDKAFGQEQLMQALKVMAEGYVKDTPKQVQEKHLAAAWNSAIHGKF